MRLLQTVGASPIQVSAPDMYTNLEKRVTDAQVIPLEAMMTFKLNEVIKYVTMPQCRGWVLFNGDEPEDMEFSTHRHTKNNR